jgi:hypothetical protein
MDIHDDRHSRLEELVRHHTGDGITTQCGITGREQRVFGVRTETSWAKVDCINCLRFESVTTPLSSIMWLWGTDG